MTSRTSVNASPNIGARKRKPPSHASRDRNGHSARSPAGFTIVRSTILTPSRVGRLIGSVTSHSRSQSG